MRGCTPNVAVNGVLVNDGGNEINDLVSSGEIAAVEVYQVSEVPVEYAGTRASMCGAILLWTP